MFPPFNEPLRSLTIICITFTRTYLELESCVHSYKLLISDIGNGQLSILP